MKFKSLQYFILTFIISNALCAQGITIPGNATFSLGSATLILPGNFENNGTFNPENGSIVFTGASSDQTYTDNTGAQVNNFTINKTSGEVLLGNNLTINSALTCSSGNLNLNGKIIYLGTSATLSESAGSIVKGASGHIETTRTLNAPNNLNVAGLGVVITSVADLGSTRIVRKHTSQPTNTAGSILRSYDISPNNNSSLNATLTMFYDSNELNGLTEADLQLFSSTNGGSSWQRQGGSIDAINKKVTLSSINSFSLWTLATNENATISNAGSMISCSEGSSVEVFGSIFLNDPDDANSAGAVIQITNNYIISEDVLSFSNKNGITGTWDNTAAKLTLTGSAGKDVYVDAIRSVKYTNSSNDATESVRTFSLVVTDGINNSNTLTKDVSVTKRNDSPFLSTNSGANIVEGGMFIFDNSYLRANDYDGSPDLIKYTIVETTKYGELFFNDELLKIGETLSFTQEDIANRKLKYIHNGGEENNDSFTFTLSDNENTSRKFTFNITIAEVNDSPEAEQLPGIVMKEDEPFLLGISFWYDNINDPDDSDSSLTFCLGCKNDNICILAISDTLFKITSKENFFGSDTLMIVIKDSSNDSCCVSTILTIEAVNDLPEITGFPTAIEITRGELKTIEVNSMISDIETPDSLLRISFDINIDSTFTNYSAESGRINILSTGSFLGETDLTITVIDEHGGKTSTTTSLLISSSVTGIENLNGIPSDYILYNNYPNPFNPSTKIRYGIPSLRASLESIVKLKIYDVLGNEITTLVNENQGAGYYEYSWNAANKASGVYFYILTVKAKDSEFRQVRKMLLVK